MNTKSDESLEAVYIYYIYKTSEFEERLEREPECKK